MTDPAPTPPGGARRAPRPGEPPAATLNRSNPRRTMTSRTRSRSLLVLPAAAAVLTLLVACSDDAAQTAEPAADQQAGEMPGGGGTTGEIAAVSDLLMQVQGDDGQTAVSWDDSTTITQTVAGTLADVTAGVCVVAITGSDDATAATSIAITAATDGECTSGFGGGGFGGGDGSGDGERPSGMPTGGAGEDGEAPSGDMPSGMPTGGTDGAGGGADFGGMTSGLVTAVDGSTITVETTDQDGTTTSETVTVDDSTTYTTTVDADSSAIAVGLCVTAQGESDDSGQVAATSLALSEAGDEGCSTGFGGQGGFGGGMPGEEDGDA
jgi:hypothetical protein